MTNPYTTGRAGIELHYRAREIAAITPRMVGPQFPFDHPCRNGHNPTVRGEWVVCATCGTPLYRAAPPKPGKR